MAVNLNAPLSRTPRGAERVMLRALQGNILAGHGRRATAHVFLRFAPGQQPAARAFLRALGSRLTSADEQHEHARRFRAARQARRRAPATPVFHGCVLSRAGYAALGIPPASTPKDRAFRAGLKARGAGLGDPKPAHWDTTYRGDVHAMVLLAGDPDPGNPARSRRVDAALAALTASLPAGAVAVLSIERGRAYLNGHGDSMEHFGYVDGRSQPLLRQVDIDREVGRAAGAAGWNPAFPMKQVLVRDPGARAPSAFGSYFVFRKLEQDVRAFKRAEAALERKLRRLDPAIAPGLAGAMIVGRFEDGTPVALQHAAGMHNPVPNDFDYAGDVDGFKCPFHSHIRKMNPRGDTGRRVAARLRQERSHVMARRGIPYGARRQDENGTFTDRPSRGVGLLFMTFQADIGNQFEFIQTAWANTARFPEAGTGIDHLIGQGRGTASAYRARWGDPDAGTVKHAFAPFVRLCGGEYFFAPSIPFFAGL